MKHWPSKAIQEPGITELPNGAKEQQMDTKPTPVTEETNLENQLAKSGVLALCKADTPEQFHSAPCPPSTRNIPYTPYLFRETQRPRFGSDPFTTGVVTLYT